MTGSVTMSSVLSLIVRASMNGMPWITWSHGDHPHLTPYEPSKYTSYITDNVDKSKSKFVVIECY